MGRRDDGMLKFRWDVGCGVLKERGVQDDYIMWMESNVCYGCAGSVLRSYREVRIDGWFREWYWVI